MSLPWKKTKRGRISRFMSEFHQSPKRGLVVETGFPTSLIDLFFKNRDRLKKSSSKRLQRIQQQTQTAPNASSLINQDTILKKPATKEVALDKTQKANCVGGGLKAEKKKRVIENSGCVCVLMAFKVFIVAVLALSTKKKKLTMGITLSTFALLLTELVIARMFTRSKLSNTDKDTSSRKKIETFDDSKDCYCKEEIRVPKSHKKSKDLKTVTENSRLQDLTVRDLLLKDEKLKSKSSGLKSKIVKKLRSYTKKKRAIMVKEECLSEVSSLVSEDKSEITESESDEKETNPPLMESKGDKMNGTVLIVIVLTGLLSGTILAIVITISCLVLRFGTAKKSNICI